MADFEFELVTEEIPASYQSRAISHLQDFLPPALTAAGLTAAGTAVSGTPRRLAIVIDSVAPASAQKTTTVRGPHKSAAYAPDGAPTPALIGFLQRYKLSPESVRTEVSGKAEYVMADVQSGGEPASQILEKVISEGLRSVRFPRVMRWGTGSMEYARPVLGVYIRLHGEQAHWQDDFFAAVPKRSGTSGHFIFDPDIRETPEYETTLKERGIITNAALRRELIVNQLQAAASAAGLKPRLDPELLDEVTFLVETPNVVMAGFSEEYLDLPEMVIVSEMEEHQRYFAASTPDGKLSNSFFIVANVPEAALTPETLHHIRSGNERVLKARLSDGRFFYNEDRKRRLADRIPDLESIAFHDGMGSMLDKARRIASIAEVLNRLADPGIDPALVQRAAELCKADLSTSLVYEFDHLQGEIGSVYALKDGESPEVAAAIAGHYYPRFQGDTLPADPLSALISLADRLDNLYAGFLLGKKPTGSADPFALRRHAIGLLSIIFHHRISFDFTEMNSYVLPLYPEQLRDRLPGAEEELWSFLTGRIEAVFARSDDSVDRRLIRSGISTRSRDLYAIAQKIEALMQVQQSGDFQGLIGVFRRMNNILSDAGVTHLMAVDDGVLRDLPERELSSAAGKLQLLAEEAVDKESILVYLNALLEVRPTIDAFFDSVMVNDPDATIRQNRLALLSLCVMPLRGVIELEELL